MPVGGVAAMPGLEAQGAGGFMKGDEAVRRREILLDGFIFIRLIENALQNVFLQRQNLAFL